MIKVFYDSLLQSDIVYDADGFYFLNGVPFKKNGLYITKGEEIIAIITNTEKISRVEYINNQPPNVVFNMWDTLSRYDKEDINAKEFVNEVKEQLKEYVGAKRGN